MRVLVIGGSGTIGQRLVPELRARGHEVVVGSRTAGDVKVDITSASSIRDMYQLAGELDAVVCIAASGDMDDFATLTEDELLANMRGKLLGQVNLVLIGQRHLAERGSFTLTSGIFADYPARGVTGGGLISGALHSFVLSAAIELPRGLRINVVSPTVVEDSADAYRDSFPDLKPVSMQSLVTDYVRCVEGPGTGEIVRAYGGT
jgi:NAD(P)-dependent dehydrogenase (short-subunit alcohol dehydrogenase family)